MCPNISRAGRPVLGAEAKTLEIKIRIEPYLCRQMTLACQALGMTRSAFIRYAIEQLIKTVKINRQI